MESICKIFCNTGTISEEDELVLIDYLYDNGVKVNLDCPHETLVKLSLQCKFKSQKEIDNFMKGENGEILENLKGNENKNKNYGVLPIDLYLKIALCSDHKTLLSLMNASSIHKEKFDDVFFKKYLKEHHPLSIKYVWNHLIYNYDTDAKTLKIRERLKLKKYRKYYFDYINAKNNLKTTCNFDIPDGMDAIETNKNAQRILSTRLNPHDYLQKLVRRFNE